MAAPHWRLSLPGTSLSKSLSTRARAGPRGACHRAGGAPMAAPAAALPVFAGGLARGTLPQPLVGSMSFSGGGPGAGTFARWASSKPTKTFASAASETEEAPQKSAPFPLQQLGGIVEPDPSPPSETFEGIGVYPALAKRLESLNYTLPTEIQVAAIPEVLAGRNAAVQSYTGSGKTLAFLLPILTQCLLDLENKTAGEGVHALVVAPSRELAMQIVREAEKVLGETGRWMVQQAIGGANINRQMEDIRKKKPMLVVGTPGRVFELSKFGVLGTHHCKILVLDEADHLFAKQYQEEMVRIVTHTGKKVEGGRQTVLVSATLDDRTLAKAATEWGVYEPTICKPARLADIDQHDKNKTQDSSLAPHLEHSYIMVDPRHEIDTLRRTIHALDAQQVLVFHNWARRLKDTEAKLKARRMAVGCLSGDMRKEERHSVLSAFRSGKLRVLVVSDVAARGLDCPDCDLVVNADLPTDGAHYAHRAGRTGRAGRYGAVVSLPRPREQFVMGKFETRLGVTIPEAVVRAGEVRIVDARVVGEAARQVEVDAAAAEADNAEYEEEEYEEEEEEYEEEEEEEEEEEGVIGGEEK